MEKNIYLIRTPSGKDALLVKGLGNYSLSDTLECGQCFRFDRIDGEYETEYFLMANNHPLHVAQEKKGELIFYGAREEDYDEYLCRYFSLDLDWEKINEKIKNSHKSEVMQKAATLSSGIAILRQDVWETLISFIISQNNNIPRIKKNIKSICAIYGEKTNGKFCEDCENCGRCYTFPTPEALLSNPDLLDGAKLGFRKRYILDAAEKVVSGEVDLCEIAYPCDFETAQKILFRICGVGAKVSSCILLFGGGHLGAFPIDVWMKRAIDEYFGGELDHTVFGEYAGVAQQYIFHYARNIEK